MTASIRSRLIYYHQVTGPITDHNLITLIINTSRNLVLLLISSQSSVLKSNKKWQNYFYRHNFRVDSASRTGIHQKSWSPFGVSALLGCWLLTGTSSGLLHSQGEAGPGRWSQSIHHRYRTPTPTLSVKTLVTLDMDIPDGGNIGNC